MDSGLPARRRSPSTERSESIREIPPTAKISIVTITGESFSMEIILIRSFGIEIVIEISSERKFSKVFPFWDITSSKQI